MFLLEKALYEIEYELTNRPGWTHIPLEATLRNLAAARGDRVMTDLSPTAREIIAGRHADPFRYLGPHTENDETVVRVFLPDARRVVAVGERGERELERIDAAGLFAGPFDDPRYRLRAQFGDDEVELEDAYRFPPLLSDYDLYLLGEGNHLRLYEKLGAHP